MGKKEKETDYLILSINLRNRVEAKRNDLIKIGGENLKFCFNRRRKKKGKKET